MFMSKRKIWTKLTSEEATIKTKIELNTKFNKQFALKTKQQFHFNKRTIKCADEIKNNEMKWNGIVEENFGRLFVSD